ncbi:MAG: hypothetical protein JXB15_07105 [Anaerolineales bacterium]|nr:hypothetical protein [Anaerolineales bacterium]
MNKSDHYRQILRETPQAEWETFLKQESGLPGPRGNLELAQVVADEGDLAFFRCCLEYTPELAPTNDPGEFVAFCGVVGLGRFLAEGQPNLIETLRICACDPRWRLREATAMALQRVGKADINRLMEIAEDWGQGYWLEMRAAVAAIAEPALLHDPIQVSRALDLHDAITTALTKAENRRDEDFKTLRKGLAYTWSVVAAAQSQIGLKRMERWLQSSDPDVRWLMKENLKKNRLIRVDAAWVNAWLARL